MPFDAAERTAMARARTLAATPGAPLGPNPRVGCVLLDETGRPIAEGHHRGAGTPHAEAAALAAAGTAARGSTAVVTLEPCAHVGRTGPCAQALVDAGVRRVVYAEPDPTSVAAGGARVLAAAGVDVAGGLDAEAAHALNLGWHFGLTHARPRVLWKFASTLDGRSAAADGTSRWVSSPAARLDTHRLRGGCDTMMVGTGTVLVDNPRLTVRDEHDRPVAHQPLRAVVGLRDLPADRQVLDDTAETVHLRTRSPQEALAGLFDLGRRLVFLEGGPTLAAAFWRAGLIDEVVAYVAPMLLGAGRAAIGDLGVTTMADADHLDVLDVRVVGEGAEQNVRLTMAPRRTPDRTDPTHPTHPTDPTHPTHPTQPQEA